MINGALLELSNVADEVTEVDVLATLLRFEKFKANLALRLLIRQL